MLSSVECLRTKSGASGCANERNIGKLSDCAASGDSSEKLKNVRDWTRIPESRCARACSGICGSSTRKSEINTGSSSYDERLIANEESKLSRSGANKQNFERITNWNNGIKLGQVSSSIDGRMPERGTLMTDANALDCAIALKNGNGSMREWFRIVTAGPGYVWRLAAVELPTMRPSGTDNKKPMQKSPRMASCALSHEKPCSSKVGLARETSAVNGTAPE